uniref:Glycosyltransferase n=1 Tax=Picea sitchensis TaxID=3332 RepID=B8LKQ5_PICSI|nr:unknown [Picea sitchensis]
MNIEDENLQCALHAVIVPFPLQSHVNALMNLAQLLAMRGFFITFVNTEWIHKRIVGDSARKANSLISLLFRGDRDHRGGRIRFLSIADGLPPDHCSASNLGDSFIALQKLSPALEHLLRSRSGNDEQYPFPAITCIVTDCVMSCTEQVATNMKVPRVIFWPLCAASSIAQCYATFLISHGHIPVTISEANNPEKLITCLPGNIPPLRPSDLNSLYRAQDPSDVLFNAILYESQKQSKGDYVLVNTFEELEGRDAVTALSLNGCPALAIGPLFLPNFLQGRDSTTSLWEEDESCQTWLDMQQPASVIYVSFGSLAVKSQEQLEQLALGLEGTGQPFLWVLRSDVAEGKPAVLPEGFEERTKERALLVRWAPQLKVLSHTSVGLFLTHSGWNSTMESMSLGVPILGFPYSGDQFLNCRFAKDVWEIGLDFEGVDVDDQKVVPKEEVEDTVKRMMRSSEGKQLRENALKLKECATRAVLPGGSSFLNLNTFVEDMARKVAAQSAQSKNETK